ncbi:YraN family protein [Microbacterium lacticum]|uniref:YraN family protein n=1 Tax=Microbacterium lacticum TaxID=33885 RepID=UPI001F586915|nr:YraN family protein [Microbacterium lacticum]
MSAAIESEVLEPSETLEDAPVDVDTRVADDALRMVIEGDVKRRWRPGIDIDLGAASWRPHAANNAGAVLHVATLEALPRWVARRILGAAASSHAVHVAITLSALYTADWRELLTRADARVYVVDDRDKSMRTKRRHVLAALADLQIPVSPDERRLLGKLALDMMKTGSAQDKGARLEALLAFLFSQVTDYRVVERNYRNSTQEIDIVLQIDSFSTRIWQVPGRPLILVEAKNRSERTDSATFAVLVNKVRTKRKSVKFAFLVAMEGFTEDAKRESLRHSTSNLCVVMLAALDVQALVEADDLDAKLETLVRRALTD